MIPIHERFPGQVAERPPPWPSFEGSRQSPARPRKQMIPRPSTREFLQEAAKSDAMTLVDLLHGYIYGRWPYFYIGVAVGEHRLNRALEPLIRWLMNRLPVGGATVGGGADPEASARKAFADGYHGKVMPLAQASRLVTVNRSIELRDLEPVIPYARARDIILRSPDHICLPHRGGAFRRIHAGAPSRSVSAHQSRRGRRDPSGGASAGTRSPRLFQGCHAGSILCHLQLLLLLLRRHAGSAARHPHAGLLGVRGGGGRRGMRRVRPLHRFLPIRGSRPRGGEVGCRWSGLHGVRGVRGAMP